MRGEGVGLCRGGMGGAAQATGSLAVEKADVGGSRSFRRVLVGELDALAFPQQLEYRTTYGRTMKEMLHATFVANEAEPFVDQ